MLAAYVNSKAKSVAVMNSGWVFLIAAIFGAWLPARRAIQLDLATALR
jgi:ABC-type antimicrobial peptide transport system permease subunit